MKKLQIRFSNIFFRYIILLFLAIPNLWIFYFVFTPLTAYATFFLFSFFFETSLQGSTILLNNKIPIELVKACVAGSAYYLLVILNLSIPRIKINKRLKMLLFSFGTFFFVNVLRIFVLGLAYAYEKTWFDIAHKLFWYAGSIFFVVAIWFAEVKIFKIKGIPFYSDLKFIFGKVRKFKKKH